jgi:hypothetical protein
MCERYIKQQQQHFLINKWQVLFGASPTGKWREREREKVNAAASLVYMNIESHQM